jgi:hypothetical protein
VRTCVTRANTSAQDMHSGYRFAELLCATPHGNYLCCVLAADGSPYGGMAYCEVFPRNFYNTTLYAGASSLSPLTPPTGPLPPNLPLAAPGAQPPSMPPTSPNTPPSITYDNTTYPQFWAQVCGGALCCAPSRCSKSTTKNATPCNIISMGSCTGWLEPSPACWTTEMQMRWQALVCSWLHHQHRVPSIATLPVRAHRLATPP